MRYFQKTTSDPTSAVGRFLHKVLCASVLVFVCFVSTLQNLYAQKNLLSLIPMQTTFVSTIHSDAINSKLPWEEIIKYEFVEELARNLNNVLVPDDPDAVREAILHPENYGINQKGNSYCFARMNWNGNVFVSYVFHISDPKKFKELIDAYFGSESNTLIQKQGEYLVLYKNNISVAWQNDHGIISFAQIKHDYYYNEETEEEYAVRNKAELERALLDIIELPEDNSYATNAKFIEWEKNVRDAGSWFNYHDIISLMNQNSYGAYNGIYGSMFSEIMPLLVEMSGEMYFGSDVSFEKGAVLSDNLVFAEPDLMELSVKIADQKVNKRFAQYLDGKNTIGYMSMAMSPKGMYEGWKELLMKKAGPIGADVVKDLFGIWEIFVDEKASLNFLKGDLLIAFNGISMQKTTYTDYVYNPITQIYEPKEVTKDRAIPLFICAFSYGKKEDMMKFIRIFSTLGLLREVKKNLYEGGNPESMDRFFVKLDKGMMVIGNDEERMVKGRKYNPLDKKHLAYLNENMQAAYFSLDRMVDAIIATEGPANPEEEASMKEMKAMLDDMTVLTGRPKSGDTYIKQSFKLELKNKEVNALKVFFDFLNKQYLNTMKGT